MGSRKTITRERIVEVAYNMACESGLTSLNVRSVAEACGVATGTLYNHVPDIAELRTEVLQRFWSEALAAAELESCTQGAETALEYCRRLASALSESLQGFKNAWLRDLGTLDGRTRQRVLQRFWSEALAAAELESCTQGAETALEYCRRLASALSESLQGFKNAWLRDLGTLDGRTRQRTMEAERACLQGLRDTVRHAFEMDGAISVRARERVDMTSVADLAWNAMLDGLKRRDGSHETLFALLELALY